MDGKGPVDGTAEETHEAVDLDGSSSEKVAEEENDTTYQDADGDEPEEPEEEPKEPEEPKEEEPTEPEEPNNASRSSSGSSSTSSSTSSSDSDKNNDEEVHAEARECPGRQRHCVPPSFMCGDY